MAGLRPATSALRINSLGAAALAATLVFFAGCGKRIEFPQYETYLPDQAAPDTPMNFSLVATLDPGAGPLRAIALDRADRLYALGAKGVKVLDADGAVVGGWTLPEDGWAVALGDDNTVYVGLAAKVLTFDAEGKPLGSWGVAGADRGQLRRITSIAVRGDDVYVADARNLCVNRYASNGDFINDIGKKSAADNIVGLITPSAYLDVACDPDNASRLLVGNTGRLRVETYTIDGKLVGWWGEPGLAPDRFEGCCNPTNVAVTRDGNIVTSEKGIPRVKVSDRKGALVAYLPPKIFPANAAGIDLAVDSNGRIYAADPVSGKVMVYTLVPAKPSSEAGAVPAKESK